MNYVEEIYFKWLCAIVFPDLQVQYSYTKLLNLLYKYHFRYDIHEHPLDQNREIDGLNLRNAFGYRLKIPDNIINNSIYHPCSILEVIVALANRIENDIMADPTKCDRTDYWAKMMLANLHILEYSNSNFDAYAIGKRIEDFLDRKYSYDGDGGLFRMDFPKKDMSKEDIWSQACYCITEISQKEGDY